MSNLTVYTIPVCPHCTNAKKFLQAHGIPFEEVNILDKDRLAENTMIREKYRTVPQIFFNGELFVEGGWSGLSKLSPSDIKTQIGLTDLGTL